MIKHLEWEERDSMINMLKSLKEESLKVEEIKDLEWVRIEG